MEALRLFWAERVPRERAILLAGAAAVLAALVFLVLIEPAYKGIGRLERSLPQQRAGAAELDSLLAKSSDALAEQVASGRQAMCVQQSMHRSAAPASRPRASSRCPTVTCK